MPRCFVIQPFDGGQFDKRFDDVLSPAIVDAGLNAYRVDRDPTVTVPIDAIESGIRDSAACIADISTDNPNVWFELGYAMSCQKPVVLICAASRPTRFPFDIQHRHIIKYNTEAPRDFTLLRNEIAERLRAALAKEASVQSLSQTALRETQGLEPHEIAALVIIAESDLDPDSFPGAHSLKQDMAKAGYTELATVLAVKALRAKGLVGSVEAQGYNESYTAYHLLDSGMQWLQSNRNRLMLKKGAPRPQVAPQPSDDFEDFPDASDNEEDDLPF